jgi:long-chain acyl-CoA synthetase
MPVDTLRPGFYANGSVEVEPPSDGQSAVRRLDISKDKLVSQPAEGVDTVYDLLQYAARTHGSRNALGWRDIVKVHEVEKEITKAVDGKQVVEKKKWKYFELSDYHYHSFVDVQRIVSEIARGFVELGIDSHEVFNVYAQTRCVAHSLKIHVCGDALLVLAQTGNSLLMLALHCLCRSQLLMIALERRVSGTLWKSPNLLVYSRMTTFFLSFPASFLTPLP